MDNKRRAKLFFWLCLMALGVNGAVSAQGPSAVGALPLEAWYIYDEKPWAVEDVRTLRTHTMARVCGVISAICADSTGGLFLGACTSPIPDPIGGSGWYRDAVEINTLWHFAKGEFRYQSPFAPNHAPHVNALVQDRRGWLWAATSRGLIVQNCEDHTLAIVEGFQKVWQLGTVIFLRKALPLGNIRSLALADNNVVWIFGEGRLVRVSCLEPQLSARSLHLWSMSRGESLGRRPPYIEGGVCLAQRQGPGVWILTGDNRLLRLTIQPDPKQPGRDQEAWEEVGTLPQEMKPAQVRRMYVDQQERVWLTYRDADRDQLYLYEGKEWRLCEDAAPLIRGYSVQGFSEDSQGRIYLAVSGNGVVVFDGTAWKQHPVTEYLPHFPYLKPWDDLGKALWAEWTEEITIPTSTLFVDRQDTLWVGSGVYLVHWTGGLSDPFGANKP